MENAKETNANKKDKSLIYHSSIKAVFEKFSKYKDVSLVYGEPIEHEDKKVIPVAKVRYSVGGGGGYSGESNTTNLGEGGGGRFSVIPMGVYEITPQKTRFKPVIDLKLILLIFTICTLGLVRLLKK